MWVNTISSSTETKHAGTLFPMCHPHPFSILPCTLSPSPLPPPPPAVPPPRPRLSLSLPRHHLAWAPPPHPPFFQAFGSLCPNWPRPRHPPSSQPSLCQWSSPGCRNQRPSVIYSPLSSCKILCMNWTIFFFI